MMDKDALAKFKSIFYVFSTGRKERISLKNGGILTISGRGDDASISVSLPKGVQFEVEKVKDNIEIWMHDQIEIKEFKVYVHKGGIKFAPNGWVVGTRGGNVVTLGIS